MRSGYTPTRPPSDELYITQTVAGPCTLTAFELLEVADALSQSKSSKASMFIESRYWSNVEAQRFPVPYLCAYDIRPFVFQFLFSLFLPGSADASLTRQSLV